MKRLVTDITKLRVVSEPFEFLTQNGIEQTKKDEAQEIIENLKHIMENKQLVALSAPQIGIKKRIFCIKFSDTIKTFINPIITKKSGVNISPETFANMPNKEILIARPQEVTVVYYNDEFKYEDNKLLGAAAQLFDQQCQVLDGILPDELGLVSDVTTDGSLSELSSEEMTEIVTFYKDYVAKKQQAMSSTISEEEQSTYNKLKFTEDVINGRTQVVENLKFQNREQRRKFDKVAKKIKKKGVKT